VRALITSSTWSDHTDEATWPARRLHLNMFFAPIHALPPDRAGARIDYVTYSPGIRATGAYVPDMLASDHRPVVPASGAAKGI
jgi:endonuclease/exonuclease/phosphatase (EEP) superfamily protein YafD